MPYNYIDFLRDQARRNTDRRRSGYVNDVDEMITQERADELRKVISRPREGTNYFYPSRYQGSGLGLRQLNYAKRNLDKAAGEDEQFNRVAFRRDMPGAVTPTGYGYGKIPQATETGMVDRINQLNIDQGRGINTSAVNPAPARQAIDAAVQGNARLGNQGARTVVSDDGFLTTYSADGVGYSRSKIPQGTNIQRTENGHTVLAFPNGLNRIVSSEGNIFDYKPQAVSDSVKDFSQPAMNPEQAASYLNATPNLIPTRNPIEGEGGTYSPLGSQPPTAPLVGTAPRPVAPTAGPVGAFGIPNVGAIAANLQTGVSNYLQRAQQSFVPYTKRKEEESY